MTQLWTDYDTKATGLIDPQDISFLVFELTGNLGKADEYQDILKNIVEENQDEKSQKRLLQKEQKYIISEEKNMILPVAQMIQILKELCLPIYITSDGFRCHFKDVCIQLTKLALKRENFIEDVNELTQDEILATEWQTTYQSLKLQV